MEDQNQAFIRKINETKSISLISGIIAIAPYLGWIFGYLLAFNNFDEIGTVLILIMAVFFLPSLIIGLLFGLISLVTGSITIIRIRKSQRANVSYRLEIVGILLGVLGIVANILFFYFLFLGLTKPSQIPSIFSL